MTPTRSIALVSGALLLGACSSSSSSIPHSTDGGISPPSDASSAHDARRDSADARSSVRDSSSPRDARSTVDGGSPDAREDAPVRDAGPDVSVLDGGWVLTWSDEFNESDGGAPDPTYWTYTSISGAPTGPGWGVENDVESAVVVQNGNLVFTATQDAQGTVYSGAIDTQGKFEQTYGRFEARIKVAEGAGAWSAFWMLGDDGTAWPTCGEIDVVETVASSPTDAYGTLHSGNTTNAAQNTATSAFYTDPSGDIGDDYHVYAVEWAPDSVKFYVDDNLYETDTSTSLTAGELWAFDHPFYVILNLEVGGSWAGAPNASSFPMTMLVDYVRVYKAM